MIDKSSRKVLSRHAPRTLDQRMLARALAAPAAMRPSYDTAMFELLARAYHADAQALPLGVCLRAFLAACRGDDLAADEGPINPDALQAEQFLRRRYRPDEIIGKVAEAAERLGLVTPMSAVIDRAVAEAGAEPPTDEALASVVAAYCVAHRILTIEEVTPS